MKKFDYTELSEDEKEMILKFDENGGFSDEDVNHINEEMSKWDGIFEFIEKLLP
mgnify:CR=1 FL=1